MIIGQQSSDADVSIRHLSDFRTSKGVFMQAVNLYSVGSPLTFTPFLCSKAWRAASSVYAQSVK